MDVAPVAPVALGHGTLGHFAAVSYNANDGNARNHTHTHSITRRRPATEPRSSQELDIVAGEVAALAINDAFPPLAVLAEHDHNVALAHTQIACSQPPKRAQVPA